METTVTHHPFRDIKLSYDRSKSQTEKEKNTVERYVQMHDGVWHLKNMREEYELRLDEAIAEINELRTALFPIEQQVEIFEVGLGLSAEDNLPVFEGTLTFEMGDFYNACDRYHDNIHELYVLMKRVTDEHNLFLEEYNRFDTWFQEFNDGQLHEIFQNWENISLDTVSLDRDHQDFLEAWGPVWRAEDAYFERAADAFNGYAELIDMSDTLFQRVKRLESALQELIKRNRPEG